MQPYLEVNILLKIMFAFKKIFFPSISEAGKNCPLP